MTNRISIQIMVQDKFIPSKSQIRLWVKTVLMREGTNADLNIRIVGEPEMATLNLKYRKKVGSTNVLSFRNDTIFNDLSHRPFLGDIVVCAKVVNQEAEIQAKTYQAHWTHIIIHGVLHLLNYDHQEDAMAKIMEAKEIALLKNLGIENPYDDKIVE